MSDIIPSLHYQIAIEEKKLRQIQTHKSRYTQSADVPRKLLIEEQELYVRLAELNEQLEMAEEEALLVRSDSGNAASSASRRLRIFLCHASEDKTEVRNLYQRLQADGVDPWLDEENLLPGQLWQEEIPKAVHNADAVLVCLSHHSVNRDGYVGDEIRFALEAAEKQHASIYLIPLRIDNVTVPERLRRWHWVNLFEKRGYERLIAALRVRSKEVGATSPELRGSDQFVTRRRRRIRRSHLMQFGTIILGVLTVMALLAGIGADSWDVIDRMQRSIEKRATTPTAFENLSNSTPQLPIETPGRALPATQDSISVYEPAIVPTPVIDGEHDLDSGRSGSRAILSSVGTVVVILLVFIVLGLLAVGIIQAMRTNPS